MPMAEYKRFIAYFYEYIDGKKQRSAGFAKVELRNGMWRILFRLTTGVMPEPPLQVYGFVRGKDDLIHIPMGMMRTEKEISEEWAYLAETPIGNSNFRLEDLAGIQMESGDGRRFLTVWDDMPIQPEHLDQNRTKETSAKTEEALVEEKEVPERTEKVPEQTEKVSKKEVAGKAEKVSEQTEKVLVEEVPKRVEGIWEKEKETAASNDIIESSGKILTEMDIASEDDSEGMGRPEKAEDWERTKNPEKAEDPEETKSLEKTEDPEETKSPEKAEDPEGMERPKKERESVVKELFRIRPHFQPFQDTEIVNCITIKPCDVVRLQQERWQVGRSSFLQHGFFQYRHLLLGMNSDGVYVLGVPGIRNPQEQYMAGMFGFEKFKMSKVCECGKVFGYWYRILHKQEDQTPLRHA